MAICINITKKIFIFLEGSITYRIGISEICTEVKIQVNINFMLYAFFM